MITGACLLLSACTAQTQEPAGPSPQEKRNNFDVCVIEFKKNNIYEFLPDGLQKDMIAAQAEQKCAYLLK